MILLLGARLNWILHFGIEPRFKKDVKFIQVIKTVLLLQCPALTK